MQVLQLYLCLPWYGKSKSIESCPSKQFNTRLQIYEEINLEEEEGELNAQITKVHLSLSLRLKRLLILILLLLHSNGNVVGNGVHEMLVIA